jgi:hypothetical protein
MMFAVFLGAPFCLAVQYRQIVVGYSEVPVQGVDFALPQEAVPALQDHVATGIRVPSKPGRERIRERETKK